MQAPPFNVTVLRLRHSLLCIEYIRHLVSAGKQKLQLHQ